MCELTEVSQSTTVYSGLGHVLGHSIEVELNPRNARARTLLDVPDFGCQKFQRLFTPVDLKRGDTPRVTCTRDATLRQKLPQGGKLPPRQVMWGDGFGDESCAGHMMASATT
jgi:hypothetical protein